MTGTACLAMRRLLSCTLATAAALLCAACGGGGPAASCHYALSVNGHGLPAAGGDLEIKVEAPAGCPWSFQGDVPWITVHDAPPAPSGNGNGTVTATIASNAGVRRAGTATIAFQHLTVEQVGTDGAGSCSFQVFPLTASIGGPGGLGAFAVVPNATDCSWWVEAHTPDDDWIDNDFHSGIGTGVATYQVVPGTTAPFVPLPRVGRIGLHNVANALVADHTVTQTP
jgi:hypothetical protein